MKSSRSATSCRQHELQRGTCVTEVYPSSFELMTKKSRVKTKNTVPRSLSLLSFLYMLYQARKERMKEFLRAHSRDHTQALIIEGKPSKVS